MDSVEKLTLNTETVINAENLRLISSISAEKINKILNDILIKAKNVAENGVDKATISVNMNGKQFNLVKEKLHSLGFTVGFTSRNAQIVEIRISW